MLHVVVNRCELLLPCPLTSNLHCSSLPSCIISALFGLLYNGILSDACKHLESAVPMLAWEQKLVSLCKIWRCRVPAYSSATFFLLISTILLTDSLLQYSFILAYLNSVQSLPSTRNCYNHTNGPNQTVYV